MGEGEWNFIFLIPGGERDIDTPAHVRSIGVILCHERGNEALSYMPSITLDILLVEGHVSLVVRIRAGTREGYSVGMKRGELECDSSRVKEVDALGQDCVIRERRLVYIAKIRDVSRAPLECQVASEGSRD